MSALEVVAAAEQHLGVIAEFVRQLYDAHGVDTSETGMLEGRASAMLAAGPVFLVSHDGKPVIYAAIKDMGDHVFIRHFVVDKHVRGQRLGRAAFHALETTFFPGRQVRLGASMSVAEPRAFWEALGFRATDYLMRREPGGSFSTTHERG